MRVLAWIVLVVALVGCAETVRCPDGQIFSATGECVPIPDGGSRPDASDASDAGP